ncbi:MAG: ATP-binding protein [Pseudobdellovibrionaceae bacterium]|jgi:PAS domain S-box-containing protein|nr:ATP-binding protein [Pseudobdellovibrionaceae bacterium]
MELDKILSQMSDYTTDAIVITKSIPKDRNLGPEIVYVNKSFTTLTGYEAEDVIGKTPKILQGEKTDKRTLARITHAIEQKKTITAELLNYSKDGYEYWVEINLNPIFCPDEGECVYFLATERDITERKTAESRLIRAIEEAEAATKAKSDFLANMSHELRTPMNGILGLAEIVQGMDLQEDVRECIDAIHSSGISLLTLLNDILDLSKIEAEELEIEEYAFRTHDILKNIKDLTSLSASRKNLNFDISINLNVPEWLCGDAKRIQQIIFNLLGNAIKFTEMGGVSLSIDYKKDANKDYLMIQIQDTGIGIPDEFHKHLFNKFSQADTSISRKFGGTGLGLAITKYLVEMMNGTIGFTSKVNHGTTFYVSIPIGEAPAQDILQTEIKVSNENALKGVNLSEIRALVVEDHPINQMLVIKWLKKLGVSLIDSAMNGFDSITLLRNNSYDFILMDCQMPELDGYETTSLIRDMEKQMNKRTPIIAMTANAMLGEREKCLAAGMDDYLSKPLNFSQFQHCIAQWIGASPNEDQENSSPTERIYMDASVPVDLTRLNEFTEGDKDTEQMVINLFLDTAYESFDMLKNAQLQDNSEDWSKAAHSMKGASGNLGAMALHSLCSDAERKGDVSKEEKSLILSNLYREFGKVESYLNGLH